MILRKLKKEDLSFLLEVRNHESTRHYLQTDAVFTLAQAEEWFSKMKHPWYIIEVDEQPVGYFRTADDYEVGADVHMNHRRKGYAKEAFKLYLKDKDYATLWVFDDNFAKVLYKDLGFRENDEETTIRGRKYIRMIYKKDAHPTLS